MLAILAHLLISLLAALAVTAVFCTLLHRFRLATLTTFQRKRKFLSARADGFRMRFFKSQNAQATRDDIRRWGMNGWAFIAMSAGNSRNIFENYPEISTAGWVALACATLLLFFSAMFFVDSRIAIWLMDELGLDTLPHSFDHLESTITRH